MKRTAIRFVFLAIMTAVSAGCSKPDDTSEDLMFMRFTVSGKVVNESGEPIPGISVVAESADVVHTDANGRFTVEGGGLPAETTAIRFMDTDKEANGRYMARAATVGLEKYKDGQGWVVGYYRNKEEVVVEMTEEISAMPGGSDAGL